MCFDLLASPSLCYCLTCYLLKKYNSCIYRKKNTETKRQSSSFFPIHAQTWAYGSISNHYVQTFVIGDLTGQVRADLNAHAEKSLVVLDAST